LMRRIEKKKLVKRGGANAAFSFGEERKRRLRLQELKARGEGGKRKA